MAKQFRPLLRKQGFAEFNTQPSQTEPEQVKPLELLLKHRMAGIPVDQFNGSFHQEDVPNLFKMDFIEIDEARQQTLHRIEGLKEDFQHLTSELAKQQTRNSEELPPSGDPNSAETNEVRQ